MKISSTEPLSIQEFEELDRLLLGSVNESLCMDAVMFDGFIAAIVCSRNRVLPSEWMTRIWDVENGINKPIFQNKEQAEKTFGLLIRHMNDISHTINQAPFDYEPLLSESLVAGNPIPNFDEWCFGFIKGLQLNQKTYDQLLDQQPELISMIWLFGEQEHDQSILKKMLTAEEKIILGNKLAHSVIKIHQFFCENYPSNLEEKIFHSSSKSSEIFFNIANYCSCGSGKNSNQCHGEKLQLH